MKVPRFKGFLSALQFSFVVVTMALTPMVCSAATGPTPTEYGIVLNLSGKQRMLSQKMSKEILLIARGIEVSKNLTNLRATSHLFDRTLKGLLDGDKELSLPPTINLPIRMQIGKVEILWSRIYPLIVEILDDGIVTDHQAWVVAEKNLHLLQEMDACVKMYEEDAIKAGLKSDPGLAVTINLSGRQRMLTQKMSKEFLLIAYGHKINNNKTKLAKTSQLFEKTLEGLINGDATLALPETTDSNIKNQLFVVKDLWTSFKPILEMTDTETQNISKANIQQLADSNLTLLAEMNKAVTMYQEEAARKM